VSKERRPADVLDDLVKEVQYEGEWEETVYDQSPGFAYDTEAFSSLKEAFLYRAHAVIREVASTWAPLGDPNDAVRLAAWGASQEDYSSLLMAFFSRKDFSAFVAVREASMSPNHLSLVLGVGVKMDHEPPVGNDGDEGRAWLGISRTRR
jgi:hypothetical protein